tara:strand:- start:1646 stop:1840 length:195 start_codon:yes stop_codon:yes gene_type:complete
MGCESVKDPKKRKRCEDANKQLKTHVAKEKAESNFNNQNFEMLSYQKAKRESLNPTPPALKKKV